MSRQPTHDSNGAARGPVLGAGPESDKSATLYAFYDLAVNPNSFDISKFLVLAELSRRRRGLAHINVIIVPDESGWARADDAHPKYHQEWRLRHILLPAANLMPTVRGVTVCASRTEARRFEGAMVENVFPIGHTTDTPVATFEWADLAIAGQHGIPSLRATEQARRYARRWIDGRANGRKVISLTFREMGMEVHRNNDSNAWLAFAHRMDRDLYFPVVIRDTDNALDPPDGDYTNLASFPEAAFDLELRAGFYEECHLNLFAPNGPAEISLLNTSVAYLFFMKLRGPGKDGFRQDAPEFGMTWRGEFPVSGPHQHVVWDGDSLDLMQRDFHEMINILERNRDAIEQFKQRDAFTPAPVAGLELCELLVRGGRRGQAEPLADRLVAEGVISPAQCAYFKGTARLKIGQAAEARPLLEQAVALDDGVGEYHHILAQALLRTGFYERCEEHLRRASALMPDAIGIEIELAMLLNFFERLDESEELIAKLQSRGVVNARLMSLRADIYKKRGRLREAIDLELLARQSI